MMPKSAMVRAVEAGNAAEVEDLLRIGSGMEETNEHAHTLLMIAAEQGNIPVMALLVAAGAKVDAACAWDQHTPLHLAAFNGHEEAAVYLVAMGAKTEPEDKDAMTAAEHARVGGHPALEVLLRDDAALAQRGAALLEKLAVGHGASARAAAEGKQRLLRTRAPGAVPFRSGPA